MKNILKYIPALILGLLLGYLFFGKKTSQSDIEHTQSTPKKETPWTCAMHPQVTQNQPGKCPICAMDLTPTTDAPTEQHHHQVTLSSRAQALGNIQTTVVGSAPTNGGLLSLTGEIVANEKSNATQTAHFAGRIEKLYINSTGEPVRKGQLLALVYSPELLASQQELLTASKIKNTQPKLYAAVRKKLQLWKLSPEQIDQIELSGKAEANVKIYANVSGIVSEKLIESGDHVKEGHPLFKISNFQTVWAVFDVYESQIPLLAKGQRITVRNTAYPNLEFPATFSFIAPVLDPKTRTLKARATLDNSASLWKPGMFVSANIQTETTTKEVIRIPKTAVLWTGKESIVYVKPDHNQSVFEMRKVTLGKTTAQFYEILNGLKTGDIVVTNGAFVVDAEAQLQGKNSMMNPHL